MQSFVDANTWMGDKGRACAVQSLEFLASFVFVLQLCLIGEVIATHAAPLCLLVFESGL